MSDERRTPDPTEPATEPEGHLHVNRETLADLDQDDPGAERVKGGATDSCPGCGKTALTGGGSIVAPTR